MSEDHFPAENIGTECVALGAYKCVALGAYKKHVLSSISTLEIRT